MVARRGFNIRFNEADWGRIKLLQRWLGESPAAPEEGVATAAAVRFALAHTVQDLRLQAKYAIKAASERQEE